MSYFIEVILPLSLPKTFTYCVSETEYVFIKKGMRIAVPFGKSKIYTALVIDLHQIAPTLYEAKEIHQILDEKPIVNEFQINHWFWIASYYMCNIGDVYRGALPSALLLESETIISRTGATFVDEILLTDDEFLIYEALQHQSSLKIQNIIDILNKKTVLPVIQKLINKNIISLQEEIQEEYKPKLIRYIRLNENYLANEKLIEFLDTLKSEKQKNLVLQYFQLKAQERKPISVKQLIETAQSSAAIVKALVQKQIFVEYFIQEDRVNFDKNKVDNELVLSAAQQEAFDKIDISFIEKEVCLLHGVTSSGKTEIYTKLIENYIAQGKQVLYLLPEIALTTQIILRLQKYFGNTVGVYHSKFNENERVEVWRKVLEDNHPSTILPHTSSIS